MAHCPAECKCPGHWGWNKLVLIKKKKKIGLKGADTFRIRTSEKPLQENSGYKVSQVSEKSEGHTVV